MATCYDISFCILHVGGQYDMYIGVLHQKYAPEGHFQYSLIVTKKWDQSSKTNSTYVDKE